MEQLEIALMDDEINQMADLSVQKLSKIMKIIQGSYEESSAIQKDMSLSFEDKLHLELQIDKTLKKLINIGIDLSEIITKCMNIQALNEFEREINKRIIQSGQKCKKTIALRELQLSMICFIIQKINDKDFSEIYSQNYKDVMEWVIPLNKCDQPINVFILQDLFKKEFVYLNLYSEQIGQLKADYKEFISKTQLTEEDVEPIDKRLNKLRVLNSKILTIVQIFPYACCKDKNDLFSFDQSHPRWQKLFAQEVIRFKSYGDQIEVNKSFDSIRDGLNVVNAAMSIIEQSKNVNFSNIKGWGQLYEASVKILKCAFIKKAAHHQAEVMISEPSGKLAKKIWNLPEKKEFRDLIQLSFPQIVFSQVLYIPRTHQKYFHQKYFDKSNETLQKIQLTHVTSYGNDLFTKTTYDKKLRIRINSPYRLERKYSSTKLINIQEQPQPQSIQQKFSSSLNNLIGNVTSLLKKENPVPDKLIFHIHGGGFISMSSFIHQTYTRTWSNNLNTPIISVDYGKAPERPFPQGLYDCLEAYLWAIEVFQQVYDASVKQIVVVGDSAGGNLVAALTTVLIQWNLRVPDGIILVYPALNLNYKTYSPSLLTALNDMILPHTFLKICLSSYLQDKSLKPETDSFISPIQTSDETLAKYPPTRIFVGNKDPFHDDCCRLVERLNNLCPNKGKLLIFDQFPHGFLQFDMKLMPNEQSKLATKQVQKAIGTLLKIN